MHRGHTSGQSTIDAAISQFGREVTRKLRATDGSPEDHLRGPVERMLTSIGQSLGLSISTIGEARLPDLSLRPDYAVNVSGARVGYIELKKPGSGVPENWPRPSQHDRKQWERYQLLPNVLYSDGQQFARYTFGALEGKIGNLTPDLEHAGERLRSADMTFSRTITDFLLWKPERPRSLDELVRLVANLCRLLRDDVLAELKRERTGVSHNHTFTDLATDWRQALFPNLTDDQFADQYAQTITFALLLARVEGVDFDGTSIGEIARLLGKKHSLMGRALTVLTDQPEEDHSVALTTMVRVLSVVDWSRFPDDSYAMLYENFLARYDPRLRRASGVYYTPEPLVSFTTRFVDDVLRKRLRRDLGFAEKDVIVVDPAMGTGSLLAAVVNKVASTIEADEGPGAVSPRLRELSTRLIGFENQAAPYAVAELRIHSLLKKRHGTEMPEKERRFLSDALDDPDAQQLPLGRMYEAIEHQRLGANEVKVHEPVMVVIGNPPYVDKVKGTSAWIETARRNHSAPSLSAFRKEGNGRWEYVLSNKYIYFWRWATWKVFDAHPDQPAGIVAFICSAGFTTGPGFAGMREYLRRTTEEGWIVDLTPEGHQPPMATRFFRGNQQPICVAVFIRSGSPDRTRPATIHRASVSGSADEKALNLTTIVVDDGHWKECNTGWGDPFQPAGRRTWHAMPTMRDLMPWASPGAKPNRTWVYAPDEAVLQERWKRLVDAPLHEKRTLLKETSTTKVESRLPLVPGMATHRGSIGTEDGPCPPLRRIAHRAFDRKWVIPDARLHHRPSPPLWHTASDQQIYVIEQHAHALTGGPGLVFSSTVPDMDCHSGRGGRVLPLFRDREASSVNVAPGLLQYIAAIVETIVKPEDLIAYLAAIAGHRGFTCRFAQNLRDPGIHIPLTRSPRLWSEAIRVGREVVSLHTYGDRFVADRAGRSGGRPRLRTGRPTVRKGIPDTEDGMPENIAYDEDVMTLYVGEGAIAPVRREVWNYDVNRMLVVKHWFGYRKRTPSGKRTSPLDDVVATTWTPAMTRELLDLLHVLTRCVELEPRQEELLDHIVAGPVITVADLTRAGILPVDDAARSAPKHQPQEQLTRS